MKKKKVLVLTDHMPWGHRSIAKAIYGYLSKNATDFKVEYAEIKSKMGTLNGGYTFLYRFLPVMNRLAVKLMSTKVVGEMWHEVSGKNEKSVYDLIKRKKPDVVISAYLIFSKAIADVRKKKKLDFKLWTVVADPWTVIPQSYIKEAECHLVYDQVALGEGLRRHIPRENILVTGWWTRHEMFEKYDGQKIKKKLGFNDDRPVIFVGGGSLGSNILAKILPSLMFVDKKVGFIFNTGTDKLALRLIKEYSMMLGKIRKKDTIKIRCFGWIDNMAEMLSACDIVFGKAGPNFLFDVVACQKPFVSITHLGGQEDGNIELIKRKKLGWVREKPTQLSRFLNQYLKDPKKYENKYREEIKTEAKKNKKSTEKILKRLKKELKK
jgi:UDP-N-acetylglucosamine:LPS N-acetylglucosamine transferase